MASALHYLSMEGIVHLDVKPDNIVMGIPPRLIDMSLARSLEDAREVRVPIGTNAYMPPEQCAPGEAGEIGSAGGRLGLAATLYHAVTGHTPFPEPPKSDEASPRERYPQLVEPPIPPDGRLSPDLAEPVMAAPGEGPRGPAHRGRAGAGVPAGGGRPARQAEAGAPGPDLSVIFGRRLCCSSETSRGKEFP